MDRLELFNRFCDGAEVTIEGNTGRITSIEREDGSGFRFNLYLKIQGQFKPKHVYLDTRKL